MFENGDWSTKINQEKQVNHMESTRKPGKSYFYNNVDVQKLVDDYCGKGQLQLQKNGNFTNKETIKIAFPVGIDFNSNVETQWVKIHYSQTRTHVSPIKPKD